jgi:hypothetical protein
MTLTYFVRRRGVAADVSELDAALTRLRTFEEQPPPTLAARWMHSYALREADGSFGMACVLRADGMESLRLHAWLCDLPDHEIVPVRANWVPRSFAPTRVFLVRRQGIGRDMAQLERRLATARRIADEDMPGEVSWLRTYALDEARGSLGSACLYQALDPGALREHARRAGLPVDEIMPVLGRLVFREDHELRRPFPDQAASA